jgi:arylsulfatase A-like enzyme
MRKLVYFVGVTFCLTAVFSQTNSATEPNDKKLNVVFFLVDDLGWTDLGFNGSTFYETPNVDQLAKTGLFFTNGYAACPVCSPTRASIMTGKYPSRLGITTYINPAGGNQPDKWKRNTKLLPAKYVDRMAKEEVTIAEAFKEAGYATFFAGKWHLGVEGFFPEDQGFDVNMGGIERGGPYGGKRYFSPYGNKRLKDGPEGEHLPDRLATETCKFIESNKDKPFFAYLSFYSVHTPLISREDLKKKYEQKWAATDFEGEIWGKEGSRKSRLVQQHAVYAGMVEAMDLAVGKVLKKLDDLGLAENTAVVFMSDNGGLSTSEGHPTSNLPLRAGKGWIYEGGIREPMIIRWPGKTKKGSKCDEPVTSTDFYPTLLEMAGLDAKPKQHVDGKSLVPLLQGKEMDRGPIYWHFPHYGNQGGPPAAAIRDGNWKLIWRFEENRYELYNLSKDIGEKKDLATATDQADRVLKMKKALHLFLKETDAKMPTRNPKYDENKKRKR